MLRFTLFGFPVTVHWMFWITTVLLGGGWDARGPEEFQLVFLWTAACFISILIHELGHALLMRHYGGRPDIVLYGLGGFASARARWTRNQDILVSLAGPAFSLILAAIFYSLQGGGSIHSISSGWFVHCMVYINWFWTLLNLLPVLPLDGGRVAAAFFRYRRETYLVGMIAAGLAALWLFGQQQPFAAVFFGFLAFRNFQQMNGRTPPSLGGPF